MLDNKMLHNEEEKKSINGLNPREYHLINLC